jgi:hypothetical protein
MPSVSLPFPSKAGKFASVDLSEPHAALLLMRDPSAKAEGSPHNAPLARGSALRYKWSHLL